MMLKTLLSLMLGLCQVLTCIIKKSLCHGLGYFEHFLLFCIRTHVVPGKLQPVLFSPAQILCKLFPRRHIWVLWIFPSRKEKSERAYSVRQFRGVRAGLH